MAVVITINIRIIIILSVLITITNKKRNHPEIKEKGKQVGLVTDSLVTKLLWTLLSKIDKLKLQGT